MPPRPSAHRPQTLKQAKNAYRRSGAQFRLSASEQALIERRAVLQERADRIKDREARRKATLKRKEEKSQRERDFKGRMGFAEPKVGGIRVAGSQMDLGRFLGVVGRHLDANPVDSGEDKEYKSEPEPARISEAQGLPMGPPPRKTLQPVSSNTTIPKNRLPPPTELNVRSIIADDWDDFFVSNTQIEREISPWRLKPLPTPAPLIRQPVQTSTPCPITAKEETEDLFAGISTQDLDYIIDFTQVLPPKRTEPAKASADISTQDDKPADKPAPSSKHLCHPPTKEQEDLTREDFPDTDLESLALEFELDSPSNSTKTPQTPHPPKRTMQISPPPETIIEESDEFGDGPSTQELQIAFGVP